MIEFDLKELFGILPIIIVAATGTGILLLSVFARTENRRYLGYLSIFGLLAAAANIWLLWSKGLEPSGSRLFRGSILLDDFALFFMLIAIACTIFAILGAIDAMEALNIGYREYYVLMLFSASGMMTMAAAGDLLTVFLGIEVMSIPVYVLAGMARSRVKSAESAMKYFVLGAFATGLLLYGMALTYGATGSTSLTTIARIALNKNAVVSGAHVGGLAAFPLLAAGLAMMLAGLCFKIGLVPFHMWVPDVYEGAPTFVTSFMATGVKAAGFAVLLRMLAVAFTDAALDGVAISWGHVLPAIAILTMTAGNLLALPQKNLKRMLAYSSIAHAGYGLMGICAGIKQSTMLDGGKAVMYYMLAYMFMTAGAFAVVMFIERPGEKRQEIYDYSGLASRNPWLAACMALMMFSLAGIPPTAGFFGKLYVFKSALDAGLAWLVIAGALNSALSVYYYIGVVRSMYMEPEGREVTFLASRPLHASLVLAVFGVLYYGVFSEGTMQALDRSMRAVLSF